MGFLSSLFGSGPKQPAKPAEPAPASSRFQPGQVWAFKTPEDQPNAKVIILRLDDGGPLGPIVHIALTGVSYGSGHDLIPHLPFAEAAIDQSVTTLERESAELPDFEDGYQLWREAFDTGKGGVFTISVAEAFDAVTGIFKDRPTSS